MVHAESERVSSMFFALEEGLPHQEAHDVPSYSTVKKEIYRSKPTTFRLTSDEYNHEVQVLRIGTRYSTPDRGYGFEAIVCPVETASTTKKGARLVHVAVDQNGSATWI